MTINWDWSDCPHDVCKLCDRDIFEYEDTWYHLDSESYLCRPGDFDGERATPGGSKPEDLPLVMLEQEQP